MAESDKPLRADPDRWKYAGETGIYVRGVRGDHWASIDIAELDRESLLSWLRSGDDAPSLTLNTLLAILGHEQDRPVT